MGKELQITNPDGGRITHPLGENRVSLGRARDNDLAYPEDAGLSRHHMVIEKHNAEWWLRDLGSKNGTLLNDQRIRRRSRLNPGDRIRASHLTLVFQEPMEERGTVIFEPAEDEPDSRPPTHTVTLGQIVARDEPTETPSDPSTQWSDPVTALLRAGRELVARKPMDELFDDILDLALESVGASRGVLFVLEGEELLIQAIRGDKLSISTAVRDKVMEERQSLLVGDVASDEMLRQRQSIVVQKVHSLMAVPLQTDERVLGLIYIDSPETWRQFSPADLNLLTVMANVAAMRIERERLAIVEKAREMMERDLKQAAEIQRQFLPLAAPEVPGFDLAGYNCPCHGVGGDYYDFVAYPDGSILVALGDVAGKGMPAALLMVSLQARVQSLAERPGTPADMVASLNRALHGVCPSNRFVTFFLARLSAATGAVSFCNAGHNPPFLVRANGTVETLQGGGPVLGIMPGMRFESVAGRLEEGDLLVAYSDGVTEANNPDGEEFGEDRLQDYLVKNRHRDASDLVSGVCAELRAFVSGADAHDDVTIVVARRK